MNDKLKKFWIIVSMLLVLLIPLAFLFGIVDDRISYKGNAENTIQLSWAGEQTISPPVMSVKDGKQTKNFELKDYDVNIVLNTEIRKKGIFKIPVYVADVNLKGIFTSPSVLNNQEVSLAFDVSDIKGLTDLPSFKIQNSQQMQSYSKNITKKLTADKSEIPFEIKYRVRGVKDIFVVPAGQFNRINISSNWKSPSFIGDFLPSKSEITNEGFNAEWSIPKLAFADEAGNSNLTSVFKPGVSLILPVDNYKMATRALKYAFLFITLTFVAFFVFEITSASKEKIHPLQYMMIGGSLLVFYLLLVSMSEFLSFGLAYIIAAAMTIALIGLYTHYVLTKCHNKKFALVISSILTLLYTYLYTLLQLTDLSLIIGSFGLFAAVAGVMFATKDVKWYDETK